MKINLKLKNNKSDSNEEIVNSAINQNTIKVLKHNITLKTALVVSVVFGVLMFVWNFIMLVRPKNEMTGVIMLNSITGEQTYVKNAIKELSHFSMDENVMLNTLKTYITSLRSVSNDDGVNRKNANFVYAYTTQNAVSFISSFYKENNPIKLHNEEQIKRDVIIYNCMPINTANGLKFQIDWNEITRDLSGKFIREQNYRADIDCKQFKATKITSDVNPIGFYVVNIGISEIKNGFITNIYTNK